MSKEDIVKQLPLWARLRVAHDFADDDEKAKLEKLAADIIDRHPDIRKVILNQDVAVTADQAVSCQVTDMGIAKAGCNNENMVAHCSSLQMCHQLGMIPCLYTVMCNYNLMHYCPPTCMHGMIYAGPGQVKPGDPVEAARKPKRAVKK